MVFREEGVVIASELEENVNNCMIKKAKTKKESKMAAHNVYYLIFAFRNPVLA